jgi:membrane protease YdiL (CAAX protease family)
MQSRLENALGKRCGLLTAVLCFTVWHYCAPFVGRTAVPLDTLAGALSTFAAGLLYAYAFQRTRNFLAPWLAHVITGIAFILAGAMDFTQHLF